MSWPDHEVPENVGDIVKVLSEVEESQREAEKKGPVVVVCRYQYSINELDKQ